MGVPFLWFFPVQNPVEAWHEGPIPSIFQLQLLHHLKRAKGWDAQGETKKGPNVEWLGEYPLVI